MKCEQAQCQILLADSDELPPQEAAELEAHLSSCADCRRYRDNAIEIVSHARRSLPENSPSSAVLARIRAAAEEQESGTIVEFWRLAPRILAYAAVLALMVGGWFMLPSREQPPQSADRSALTAITRYEQMCHIDTIVTVLSDLEYRQDADEQRNGLAENQDIRELARQLLILEGLSAEVGIDEEIIAPDVELLPTDLRSSNSSALVSKECV
jgi:hypothetical protein